VKWSEVKSLRQIEAASCSEKLVFSYKDARCCGEEHRGLNFIVYITTDTLGLKNSSSIYNWLYISTVLRVFQHFIVPSVIVLCKVGKIKSNLWFPFPHYSLCTICRCSRLMTSTFMPQFYIGFHALCYYVLSLKNGSYQKRVF
jgi:hypothetical protein